MKNRHYLLNLKIFDWQNDRVNDKEGINKNPSKRKILKINIFNIHSVYNTYSYLNSRHCPLSQGKSGKSLYMASEAKLRRCTSKFTDFHPC